MKLADGLDLGYLGVDFVLDAAGGPVVLEANARPGLNIQVANRCGLLPRLRLIDAQPAERLSARAAWTCWPRSPRWRRNALCGVHGAGGPEGAKIFIAQGKA